MAAADLEGSVYHGGLLQTGLLQLHWTVSAFSLSGTLPHLQHHLTSLPPFLTLPYLVCPSLFSPPSLLSFLSFCSSLLYFLLSLFCSLSPPFLCFAVFLIPGSVMSRSYNTSTLHTQVNQTQDQVNCPTTPSELCAGTFPM